MKNKTKLSLFGAVISCATLATAVTATHAWFVTRDSVTLSYSSITVASNVQNMDVSLYEVPRPQDTDPTVIEGNSYAISTPITIGAVSSSTGLSFVAKEGSSYTDVPKASIPKYAHAFGLAVSTKASLDSSELNVSVNWAPDRNDNPSSVALAQWIRVGVMQTQDYDFDIYKADGVRHFYCSNASEDQIYASRTVPDNAIDSQYAVQKGETLKLCAYSTNAKHYFRFTVWMEGTYSDEQDIARGGKINLTVNLSSRLVPGE